MTTIQVVPLEVPDEFRTDLRQPMAPLQAEETLGERLAILDVEERQAIIQQMAKTVLIESPVDLVVHNLTMILLLKLIFFCPFLFT